MVKSIDNDALTIVFVLKSIDNGALTIVFIVKFKAIYHDEGHQECQYGSKFDCLLSIDDTKKCVEFTRISAATIE
jgi:hypothetical protein